MEKLLVEKFPCGATKNAYAEFFGIDRKSIPDNLEYLIVPGRKWRRICPYAMAGWITSGRVPGYYNNLIQ